MDLKNITLGEWLSIWYDTYKKPYLKPYSLRNIDQMIRLHTPDWLKSMKMKDISIFDIEKALSAIPLGRTYIYARQVWHSAFTKAHKLGIVSVNVLTLTDKVTYKKRKSKALTLREQTDFIKALENKRFKWVMLFYLHTGVRRAEALDITRDDIDEENGLIHIKGTKTEGSDRYIIMTPDVQVLLIEQQRQNRKEKLKTDRIFPYCKEQMSRFFKSVCPNHHLHDLRHTYITRCAECGVSVSVCQQLVGHSTADMTMNVYTHVMDEFKRKEALKFRLFPKL
ncbi:MAG: site-specific integrase [Clostridia bacterium]|nr:site-specific integrase [Clostridia bacterium]